MASHIHYSSYLLLPWSVITSISHVIISLTATTTTRCRIERARHGRELKLAAASPCKTPPSPSYVRF